MHHSKLSCSHRSRGELPQTPLVVAHRTQSGLDTSVSAWFSVGYAFAGAATELTAGAASRISNVSTVFLLSAPAALAVSVAAAVVNPGEIDGASIGWGVAAGIVGGAALPVAFHALAIGSIGVVASVIACTSTISLTVAGVMKDGSPPMAVWAGVILSLVAIVLLAQRSRRSGAALASIRHETSSRPSLAVELGIVAGLGFGGFTFLMSLAERNEGGPAALVAARAAVLLVAVAVALVTRAQFRPTLGVASASISAGVLDVLGNLCLLAALATTPLIVVAVVGATSPAIAAAGALLLFRERLTAWQVAGLALAATGAVLASGAQW